jgi:acyl carrier protein
MADMSSPTHSFQDKSPSREYFEEVLAVVIDRIRTTIDEEWIRHFDIEAETRFNDDLEIESIEFMKITDAVQAWYGGRLDIVGWLSSRTINELIGLSVGDLARFVAGALSEG